MKNTVVPYKPPPYCFWSLIVVGVAFMGLHHPLLSSQKKVLDHHGSVPEFQLFNQEGEMVTLKDLKGDIWVAAFIFTRCRGPCPIITTHMAELNKILREGNRIKLVSITVDPYYDTPKVLSRYAGNFHADPKRWIFLTGPKEKVEALVISGMYQAVVRGSQSGPIHSTQLVLVDPHGQIRAIHDGMN